jgi:enoyl-CoA hydratase/carnithine racemase
MTEPGRSFIEVSLSAPLGYIRICRPEKKNALTTMMHADMLTGLRRLESDPACKAVIISGEGGNFSSGADLGQRRDPALTRQPWTDDPAAQFLRAVATSRIPVIAAVDGWAIGMALAILGGASEVVAAPDARFMLPEARSGYLPAAVLPHLTYRMPAHTILRWALSGDVFSAGDAFAAGLVTRLATGPASAAADAAAEALARPSREVIERGMRLLHLSRQLRGAESAVAWGEQQMDVLLGGGPDE